MLKTEDVKRELAAIVEEFGADTGFGNGEGCHYRKLDGEDAGAPRCIVGHLLARLEPEFFAAIEVERFGMNGMPVFDLVSKYKLPVENTTLKRQLDKLQELQDGGMPWGEAVDMAGLELEPEGVLA